MIMTVICYYCCYSGIACTLLYARERGGDGYSQTRYTSSASNTTCTHRWGYWYNTGSVGITTNGNSSSQNFSLTGEAPHGAWVFTESA